MIKRDTIAAIATAAGQAGIGVVRVSGSSLSPLIEGIIGSVPAPRHATLAAFHDSNGEAIDQGIALFFPGPRSYTGEDVFELQAHGGPAVLRMLLGRCQELGARVAEPGEFTQRAYLNGNLDLAQAESVADLIAASTTQGVRSAARSLRGHFSDEIQEVNSEIIALRILVEATLDFPEEEGDFLGKGKTRERLTAVRGKLNSLLDNARQGSLLREGMQIVLAGRPNVGKSSLLNRLAGEDLAIVTDVPGTTRDAIRQVVDLDGVPAHFVDTAGLRDALDPVEHIGIERAWSAIGGADVVMLVTDATSSATPVDESILRRLPPNAPRLRIVNKIDLLARGPAITDAAGETVVWLSAKTGEGVQLLRQALLKVVGWQGADGVFMARERHLDALRRAAKHLALASGESERLELFAEELRLAHEALGSIIGSFTSDDLLGEIFSRFCIGK